MRIQLAMPHNPSESLLVDADTLGPDGLAAEGALHVPTESPQALAAEGVIVGADEERRAVVSGEGLVAHRALAVLMV